MSNTNDNTNRTFAMSIHSATLTSVASDYNLLTQQRVRQEYFSDKTIILELIKNFPEFEKFEFLALTKRDRRMMYIAMNELSIPFSKIRIDENFAIIGIVVNNHIRHNLDIYHTNNLYLIHKYKNENKISNNMQKKLLIADIIFDIKDTMKDSMFKELMETLNEITN
tara:strand:- start:1946 stop:2446 length:501 start_codon:yes stop_codon:yes gene_type:complete